MQKLGIEVLSVEEFKRLPTVKAGQTLFPRKKVLILDLNNTMIQLSDFLNDPLKPHNPLHGLLSSLRDLDVAICVTYQTISRLDADEVDPNFVKSIQLLDKTFPGLFDLFLHDPKNTDNKSGTDATKQAMLQTCQKAYGNDATFSFISLKPHLLKAIPEKCTSFDIFDGKASQAVDSPNQIGLLSLALKKAGMALTGQNILAMDTRSRLTSTVSPSLPRERPTAAFSPASSTTHKTPVTSALPRARAPVSTYVPPRVSEQQKQPQVSKTQVDVTAPRREAPQARQFDPELIKKTYTDRAPQLLREHGPKKDADDAYWLNEALIRPAAETATLPLGQWFKRHFLQSPLITELPPIQGKSFKDIFVDTLINLVVNVFVSPFKALLLIYGFDGYDPIKNEISYAEGAKQPEKYTGDSITDFSPKLFVASFLGLPSRAIKREDGNGPTITWKQIGKNFLGGLDWNYNTPIQKKRLQIVGIPVKALILLVKLITLPFKAIINAVKLLTEFLPWVATSLSYVAYQITVLLTKYSWLAMKATWNKSNLTAVFVAPLFFLLSVTLALSTVALFAAHYACRALMIIGRAITSPERAVRMAYAYGSEVKVPFGSERVQRGVAKFIGLFGAAISMTITAITWAICFPLLINFVMNFVPPAAWLVNAFLNWQPVVNTISALQGTALTVGSFLHSAFGSAAAAITNFIGVQITTSAVVAAVASPFMMLYTRLLDVLSNRWANWHEGGIFNPKPKANYEVTLADTPASANKGPGNTPSPSPIYVTLDEERVDAGLDADKRQKVAAARDRVARMEPTTPSGTTPAAPRAYGGLPRRERLPPGPK